MASTTEDRVKAKKILDDAVETLRLVDQAYVFTVKKQREFPTFHHSEIVLGGLLGLGGFSGVHEIKKFQLRQRKTDAEGAGRQPIDETTVSDETETAAKVTPDDKSEERPKSGNPMKILPKADDSSISRLDSEQANKIEDHAEHYDVVTAREFMSENSSRYGSARYAVKILKPDLGLADQARGAVDLAIEIKYLSTIWHPNIIKMRGCSDTPRVDNETFLILDRLYGTLHDKIEVWAERYAVAEGCCGLSKKSPEMQELLKERLLVAYDLSSAVNYLHGLKLLYRDLKPENIGFDIRGDVKLFDFGLCKNMERDRKVPDAYGYNLTARTGSIPYMAPENALGKPYDREADVYSFAVLLWEIMGLEWAYNGYAAQEYFVQVCALNFRLDVKRGWPAMVRVIILEGWDPKPEKRPNMKRVGNLLRGELEDMTTDSTVLNRTEHMMNKSRRSHRGFLDGRPGRRADGSRGRQSSMLSSRSERGAFRSGDKFGTEEGTAKRLSSKH